jgi:hypothetical protein
LSYLFTIYQEKIMKQKTLLSVFVSLFLGCSLIGETTTDELTSGYNSPGRIDVKGSWDVFITGSYIYWQPREEGLELGCLVNALNPSTETSPYQMAFDYKSGFKVGLGTNLDHDNWVAYLDYTRLHMKDHRSANLSSATTTYRIRPFWNCDDNLYEGNYASASWKLRYDILELILARPFYSGTCLTLNGIAGLKGGWINQKYRINYTDSYDIEEYGTYYTYTTTSRTNSWVIGPQAGCDMNCLLGAGFRFFGDFSASLLYQRLKTTLYAPNGQYYVLRDGEATYLNEQDFYSQITPNVNVSSGFGWGTYFDKNNWHFDLSASYDFNYYWSQNHMKRTFDEVNWDNDFGVLPPGKVKDLILHGLTITARLDF